MIVVMGIAMLLVAVALQSQTPAPKPGPEQKKLGVWAGTWAMQGEGKDSPNGPSYKLDWSWQGRWLPEGFFLEIRGSWKSQGGIDQYLEVLGYDAVRKTHFGHVFHNNGNLEIYTSTFNDRSCMENGTTYSLDGKTTKWRNAWNFSPDLMSASGKGETETDGKWWTSFEVKGTKSKAPAK
jgi:hypothetical protein